MKIESGVKSQESGVKSQESRVKSQESRVRIVVISNIDQRILNIKQADAKVALLTVGSDYGAVFEVSDFIMTTYEDASRSP